MNKLEEKLQKQIRKSHEKWMTDTCDLYENAGLWPPDAGVGMSLVLMEALASVWAASDGVDEEGLISLLRRMTEARRKLVRKLLQEHVNGH